MSFPVDRQVDRKALISYLDTQRMPETGILLRQNGEVKTARKEGFYTHETTQAWIMKKEYTFIRIAIN